MKLLIVDDSPYVVQGLLKGIDWAEIGITKVYTAYNVVEARRILTDIEVDVLLCDIEMPGENGINLLEWVKARKLETKSILLTGHAEFDYAQRAVQLGAINYIIQPAPYEDVRNAVVKAVAFIRQSRYQKKLQEIGSAVSQQNINVANYALVSYLRGGESARSIKKLIKIGFLPSDERPCFLILLQLLHWKEITSEWEIPLLETALKNMIHEVFAPSNQFVSIAFAEQDVFCILLQEKRDEVQNIQMIERGCKFLESASKQYLNFDLAFYISERISMYDVPVQWKLLINAKDGNVAQHGGVFSRTALEPHEMLSSHIPQSRRWKIVLDEQGGGAPLKNAVFNDLDKLVEQGKMSAPVLRSFYHSFMEILYSTLQEAGLNPMGEMFQTAEGMELYRNGMKSVEQMKALVEYVASCYPEKNTEPAEQDEIIRVIKNYIASNLDDDFRRNDLAAMVHLNPDYLTRIWKKNTGITLKEYIIQQKMEEAKRLLQNTSLPVSLIAAKLGYSNFSYFSYLYKKTMGTQPQNDRDCNDQ